MWPLSPAQLLQCQGRHWGRGLLLSPLAFRLGGSSWGRPRLELATGFPVVKANVDLGCGSLGEMVITWELQ